MYAEGPVEGHRLVRSGGGLLDVRRPAEPVGDHGRSLDAAQLDAPVRRYPGRAYSAGLVTRSEVVEDGATTSTASTRSAGVRTLRPLHTASPCATTTSGTSRPLGSTVGGGDTRRLPSTISYRCPSSGVVARSAKVPPRSPRTPSHRWISVALRQRAEFRRCGNIAGRQTGELLRCSAEEAGSRRSGRVNAIPGDPGPVPR